LRGKSDEGHRTIVAFSELRFWLPHDGVEGASNRGKTEAILSVAIPRHARMVIVHPSIKWDGDEERSQF